MGENEIKQKMESNTSFLNETKALAISTEDAKEIHELMNLEDLIHGINIRRDLKNKTRFGTLSPSLIKNSFLTEDDFMYLFEVLQGRYEMSSCAYKDYVKAQINELCVEAIKREFISVRAMVFAKHPAIRNLKAVRELM
ncbi:TPA: hypothetical protein DIC40_02835 [Patescibacteria group bacterium]|nr:hypothetical protein P148_SR1C00001G0357 [candidate division SR1 bacterium RAAC1_SR1_1]HCY20783.1 hypothetical protein [Candidatus Gracilibacteria bacterium]